MAQSIQPGRFGHSGKPDEAWLAKQEKEQILEPDLPIIDTHHHLWDRGGWTYLLPELLADLDTGHNIVGTVFEECRSMYRADGPVEMRPVGEIEFAKNDARPAEGVGLDHIAAHAEEVGVNLANDVGPAEHQNFAAVLLAPIVVERGIALVDIGAHRAVVSNNALADGLEKVSHQWSVVGRQSSVVSR